MSLAKVTFIKSVKVRRCGLCVCVAACYIKSMVVCVLCAQHTAHTTNVTLARLMCKLPDDGRRPKHVGAFVICFNVNFNVF